MIAIYVVSMPREKPTLFYPDATCQRWKRLGSANSLDRIQMQLRRFWIRRVFWSIEVSYGHGSRKRRFDGIRDPLCEPGKRGDLFAARRAIIKCVAAKSFFAWKCKACFCQNRMRKHPARRGHPQGAFLCGAALRRNCHPPLHVQMPITGTHPADNSRSVLRAKKPAAE